MNKELPMFLGQLLMRIFWVNSGETICPEEGQSNWPNLTLTIIHCSLKLV